MSTEKLKPADIIEALHASRGMVYVAARQLRCAPNTVYNYARRYPSVQAAIDQERGLVIDQAEIALIRAIQNGEGWAVSLALKTIGKHRGYVERQEFTGKDGGDFGLAVKRLSVADEADIDDEIKRLEGDVDPDEEAPLRAEAYRLPPGFGEPV